MPVSRAVLLATLMKLALLKRISRSGGGVDIQFGDKIIHGPDYHLISVLLKEKFVEGQYYFDTVKQQPVIIDCGANIGISALYFKSLYPHSIVHCFEPYSKAVEYLKRNIEENGLQDVHVHREAVAASDGEIKLNIPADANMLNPSVLVSANSPASEMVKSIKLSSFINSVDEEIDLIKLDVEGAEYEIVEDLNNSGILATGKVRMLIIEYHDSVFKDAMRFEGFIGMLSDNHYEVLHQRLYPSKSHSDVLIKALYFNR